jgi:dienelactone hydrolase
MDGVATANSTEATVTERADVQVPSGDEYCAAWWYPPDGPPPYPVVVLAHGLGGIRRARLDAYAQAFRDAGFAAVVFDYRHLGDSPGEPRQLVDIGRQLDDWRAALAYARARPDVDPERIALWGTSFSGGHVCTLAAEDPHVAAAIAQVPFADGRRNRATGGARQVGGLVAAAVRDRLRARRGAAPYYVPLVAAPGELAAMNSPDALPGYLSLLDDPERFDNRIAARFFLQVPRYRPALAASRIACPLLVQVADRDSVANPAPAIDAARAAPHGELRRHDLGHFDVYTGAAWEKFVAEQVEFLDRHLGG